AIFAPYLVLIVLLGHLLQKRRRAAAARAASVGGQRFLSSAVTYSVPAPREV
ncbi:MAG: hypothetical protein JWL69_560, partial [Phycisphaerales bacterium]|nr:hypothetical protein [Phycisphaerales bacterium]